MTDTVLVTDGSHGRKTVTLNRPEVHNAFDDMLIARLTAALEDVARSDARMVVLTGAGKSFSAGGDLAVVCTDQRLRDRLVTNGFDRAVRVVSSISAA